MCKAFNENNGVNFSYWLLKTNCDFFSRLWCRPMIHPRPLWTTSFVSWLMLMSQSSSECWKWRYLHSFDFDPAALSSFSSLFLPVFPSLLFSETYCGCGNVFSFRLVICQNIAMHALPMARNSALLIQSSSDVCHLVSLSVCTSMSGL